MTLPPLLPSCEGRAAARALLMSLYGTPWMCMELCKGWLQLERFMRDLLQQSKRRNARSSGGAKMVGLSATQPMLFSTFRAEV